MNGVRTAVAAAALAAVGIGAGVILSPSPLPRSMPCVRAPLDGGTDCQRLGALLDGGAAFFGTGNVFPASQAVGRQCEAVPAGCPGAPGVMFGVNPDLSL